MLQAITFDFWGTLYQNAHAHEERLCLLSQALERHSQSRGPEELEAAYQRAWSMRDRVWREEQRSMSIRSWLSGILSHLDADLPEDAARELRRAIEEVYLHEDTPRPVPGVIEVLPRLSRRYRMGLISDTGLTPGRVLRKILRRDGLSSYLSVLTFSDEVGMTKPQPKPFLHTLDALDAQPERAVHIGDLPETDLTGARDVGMKAILFLGVSRREDGRPLADGVFEKYDELEALLEKVSRRENCG